MRPSSFPQAPTRTSNSQLNSGPVARYSENPDKQFSFVDSASSSSHIHTESVDRRPLPHGQEGDRIQETGTWNSDFVSFDQGGQQMQSQSMPQRSSNRRREGLSQQSPPQGEYFPARMAPHEAYYQHPEYYEAQPIGIRRDIYTQPSHYMGVVEDRGRMRPMYVDDRYRDYHYEDYSGPTDRYTNLEYGHGMGTAYAPINYPSMPRYNRSGDNAPPHDTEYRRAYDIQSSRPFTSAAGADTISVRDSYYPAYEYDYYRPPARRVSPARSDSPTSYESRPKRNHYTSERNNDEFSNRSQLRQHRSEQAKPYNKISSVSMKDESSVTKKNYPVPEWSMFKDNITRPWLENSDKSSQINPKSNTDGNIEISTRENPTITVEEGQISNEENDAAYGKTEPPSEKTFFIMKVADRAALDKTYVFKDWYVHPDLGDRLAIAYNTPNCLHLVLY